MEDSSQNPPLQTPTEEDKFPVKALPTIDRYMKIYGKSCDGNDRKGAGLFKEYEPADQLQRLVRELHAVRTNKAPEALCERIIGKSRKSKYESYSRWATMMIGAINKRG